MLRNSILVTAIVVIVLASAWIVTAEDRYFHAAAHNPGANDTLWLTDGQIFNPNAVDTIEVSLAFLPSGQANPNPEEFLISIGPRQAALLPDLVSSVLGRAEAGAVRISSDAPFIASSRTYNIGDGESGTFGQYIAAASAADALQQGILLLAANDPAADGFRTNVGFVNPTAGSVTIEVAVYDADSAALLGDTDVVLPAHGFTQLNNIFGIVGQGSSVQPNAIVEFSATGAVLGYGSIIDNTSGDAIFVTARADDGTPPMQNNPPTATIDQPDADVSIAPGDTVFFSGSASDPDGDDVSVLWDFGDGMTSTELEPGDHTFADAGQYDVTLTATDDQGLADPTPAVRTITVAGSENSPPNGTISEPATDVTIAAGESVFFAGSTSDPDGDAVTALWDFGDGTTSTMLNPGSHVYGTAGTYAVTFTATDDQGLADPSPATRTITVTAPNSPPDATIDQPSGNVTINAGEMVFFSGSTSDPDGDAVTVLWDFGDGITSTSLSPGNHTYMNAGVFTVTLTATDSQGLADPTPATRTVTVNAAATTLTEIQNQIFTPSCAGCHGGGGPSAGLSLEAGQAHANLVNVPASTQSGTRVVPGNPSSSVLVTFLQDGHRSRPQSEIDMISDWILAGAADN